MGQLTAFRINHQEIDAPKHEAVFELLRRAGFVGALWRKPTEHQWSVVGEVDGLEVIVSCLVGDQQDGFFLQVQNPKAREWLLDFLAENDWWDVEVRAEPIHEVAEPAPWIALTVVIGAVALFGWVVTSIGLRGG